MITDHLSLESSLHTWSVVQQSVNFTFFAINKAISRYQIVCLVRMFTLNAELIQPIKMAKFGYSYYNGLYHFKRLLDAGYIIRVRKGNYSLTPSGLELVNTFLTHSGLKK